MVISFQFPVSQSSRKSTVGALPITVLDLSQYLMTVGMAPPRPSERGDVLIGGTADPTLRDSLAKTARANDSRFRLTRSRVPRSLDGRSDGLQDRSALPVPHPMIDDPPI